MARAKTGVVRRRRHKKVLKRAKGFWGLRSKVFRRARETLLNRATYTYRDRRRRKSDLRRLWIMRINAASRQEGLTYGALMHGLRQAKVDLDRKVLAYLAVHSPDAFRAVAETARQQA